jgi:two-component system LytT family response regulator
MGGEELAECAEVARGRSAPLPDAEHRGRGWERALYDELEPDLFLRVHRSFVVNLAAVSQVERRQRGLIELILASGARVPVGRTCSKTVRTRLQATGLRP